jgi:hypothetical protein
LLFSSATAWAANTDNLALTQQALQSEKQQVTISGSGLQSLVNELTRIGIDPNKLQAVGPDGQVISIYTPGAQVAWMRSAPVTEATKGLTPADVASGIGSAGQIEVDTLRVGNTVYVYTWIYELGSEPGAGQWVALGVTSYTIQATTNQK